MLKNQYSKFQLSPHEGVLTESQLIAFLGSIFRINGSDNKGSSISLLDVEYRGERESAIFITSTVSRANLLDISSIDPNFNRARPVILKDFSSYSLDDLYDAFETSIGTRPQRIKEYQFNSSKAVNLSFQANSLEFLAKTIQNLD